MFFGRNTSLTGLSEKSVSKNGKRTRIVDTLFFLFFTVLPVCSQTVYDSLVLRLDTSFVRHTLEVVDTTYRVEGGRPRRDSLWSSMDSVKRGKRDVVALKNNLLYDAVLTPNLQLETRLAPKWSLEVGAGFNPFPLKDETFPKWRHVLTWVQPKYWFCEAFTRDFLAFNVAYTHYNVGGGKYPVGWLYKDVLNHRYEGNAVMAGLSYGWHFPISPHFSIELEAGADAGYAWFDKYECKHCGDKKGTGHKWFAVPKLGVSLVVLLDGNRVTFEDRCDCGKEFPIDTIAVYDTTYVSHTDTVIRQHYDTFHIFVPAPVPIDTVPVDTTESELVEEIQRIRRGLFRPISEYEPYTTDMVLSKDPNAVYIHFDVGRSKFDMDYMHNDEILDSIISVMDEYMNDTTIEIRFIQIIGMASFDGKMQGNLRLAENRALALRDYIRKKYTLPNSMFVIANGGEGWSELRWHIEQRDFEGKEEVLHIIDTEADLDRREQRIKQLHGGKTWQYLKENVTRYQRNSGNVMVFYEEKK